MNLEQLHKWLESRLDEIIEQQTEIKITLAKQAKDIEHHIKRTDTLEILVRQSHEFYIKLKGVLGFLGVMALVLGMLASWSKINS